MNTIILFLFLNKNIDIWESIINPVSAAKLVEIICKATDQTIRSKYLNLNKLSKKLLEFLINNESFSISLDDLINSGIFKTTDEIKSLVYEEKIGKNFCILKKFNLSEDLKLIPVNIKFYIQLNLRKLLI